MTDVALLGHFAVRVSDHDRNLVIDAGVLSDLSWVKTPIPEPVAPGSGEPSGIAFSFMTDRFVAAGFDVTALGGDHAQIYPGCCPVRPTTPT